MKDYVLKQPAAGGQRAAAYLEYLLKRLTDYRRAGSSFGQKHHGQITIQITRRIIQSQLAWPLNDETHFEESCAHIKAKIDDTILGRRNGAKGVPNYHPLEDHGKPKPQKCPHQAVQTESVGDNRSDQAKRDTPTTLIEVAGGSVVEGRSGAPTDVDLHLDPLPETLTPLRARARDPIGVSQTPMNREHAQSGVDADSIGDNSCNSCLSWVRLSEVARALGCDKKTAHARAAREQWPVRKIGNRFEVQSPIEVQPRKLSGCSPRSSERSDAPRSSSVKFTDLTHSERARVTALLREQAVLLAHEIGRPATVAQFVMEQPEFSISMRSLERWEVLYRENGLDGVCDQRRGQVGRRPVFVPEEFARQGKAIALEKGSVARAARQMMSHPDLTAELREHLHEGHASKSYVTPAIRRAFKPAASTAALACGHRAARLSSRWTPGDYSNVKAGNVFTSDDMTSNVYCWTEWPNARGWIIRQAQVLPVMDVGSLRWLNLRVVVRESGQYTSDDIWGLFGDVFETFGLPRQGFLLEGGSWQGNAVRGHKTGLSDEDRIGGLASLGLKMFRSYDPRSKGMLEGAFNQLQYVMDAAPGFAGRQQRTQLPERVKRALYDCEKGAAHPREQFLHVGQLANRIQTAMENLNNERQDGQILRGQSPLEKWGNDFANAEQCSVLRSLPDEAKWLYRSAKSVTQVTRNGVRVTQGSGAKLVPHYYDNPELFPKWQGNKVVVYWNDHRPEADAVILEARTRRFLGLAKYVQPLDRFGATAVQLDAEAARKRAGMHCARSELREIQPLMQRRQRPEGGESVSRCVSASDEIGERIAQADARAREAEDGKRKTDARVRSAGFDDEDLAAALEPPSQGFGAPSDAAEEISRCFASEPMADDSPPF